MRNATVHDGTRRDQTTRTRRHDVTIQQNDTIESMTFLRNHDGNFQAQESSGNDGVVAAPGGWNHNTTRTTRAGALTASTF